MTAHARSLAAAMVIGVLLAASACAQIDEPRPAPDAARAPRPQDDLVSFEPFYRAITADSVTVDVLFRFRRDFLVFARQAGEASYSASVEVTVELLDSADNSAARRIRTLPLTADDNSQASLKQSYEEGFFTFRVKQGHYMALCIISDKQAEHKQFSRRIPLRIPRPRIASSSLLLATAVDSSAGIRPCNLGGSAFFDSPLYAAAVIPSRFRSVKAVYSLDELKAEGEEKQTVQKDTAAALMLFRDMTIVPERDSARGLLYRFARDTGRTVAVFSLGGERLAQRRYMLRVKLDADGDTASLVSDFSLIWIGMPQSLRDLDFATAAMKYITTEEEFDQLTSGRTAKRIEAFDAFWKKRDPTPATAYNERLAEYFRRVDYAFTAFRTLKEENGALTDRGRVFILYGKPAETRRLLSPSNAPREVWQYPALKKLFTFEDSSRQGNYKLIQTDTQ